MLPHSGPVFPESGSQSLPPRQASMISCHASPVALLHRWKRPKVRCKDGETTSVRKLQAKILKHSPEEQHQGHDEGPEVIVLIDGTLSLLVKCQIPK